MPDDIDLHVRPNVGHAIAMYVLGPTIDGEPDKNKSIQLPVGYYFGETTDEPFGVRTEEVWVKVWYQEKWVGYWLNFLEAISFHQPGGRRLTNAPINLRRFPRAQLGFQVEVEKVVVASSRGIASLPVLSVSSSQGQLAFAMESD
ncbi:MAG: hypothetical protein WC080_01430 [Patescibacteria group bacterium]